MLHGTMRQLVCLVLVDGRIGELRCRKADLRLPSIEDCVEPLEEDHAIDEIETFPGWRAEIGDDEEDLVRSATDSGIELGSRVSVDQKQM